MNRFLLVVAMRVEEKYKLQTRIGEGAQSVVFLGTCRQSGMAVAIKQIKSLNSGTERSDVIPITKLAANFREIAILQRLRTFGSHPHIVDLIEVIFDDSTVYIVMDHCGMNLSEYIARFRTRCMDAVFGVKGTASSCVPLSVIRTIMAQILSAIAFVHSHLVIHRDIKPQNIFVRFPTEDHILIKVGDFGLSKAYTFPVATETLNVASLWYRSPEVILQSGYDLGLDLWGIGCVLAEMASGVPLFIESSEFGLLMKIFQTLGTPDPDCWNVLSRSLNYSPHWPKWSRDVCLRKISQSMTKLVGDFGVDLLLSFFYYESNQRMRAAEALSHPFLQGLTLVFDQPTAEGFDHTELSSF